MKALKKTKLLRWGPVVALVLSLPVQAAEELVDAKVWIDSLWVILAAALVFLMQAGFTALEAGCIRAKNSYNVAIKNIADFVIAFLGFWLLGFGIMFGLDSGGFIGEFVSADHHISGPQDYAFFLFQAMFVGTAATIVAGAVAERMRFQDYLYISVLISCVIYPVSGHWIWGSALVGGDGGWLEQQGFVDFAGSTVVHSVGGWVALAGALVLGPRLGRFNDRGEVQDIPGHNLVLATLGVFLLWFGWFGFNGGSTLAVNEDVPMILVNTNLSAAAGGLTVLLISLVMDEGKVNILKVLNGALGGLVGITAGCQVLGPWGAIITGIISGMVLYMAEYVLLNWMKVDDPIGAVAVHGVCGVWGTIALALFAPIENLPLDSRFDQFVVQLTGAFSVFVWAFTTGLIFFWLLRTFGKLRISPEEEQVGLNVAEHNARTAWLDTMNTVQKIIASRDLSLRAEVEAGTEAGETAQAFNALLDQLEQAVNTMAQVSQRGLHAAKRVRSASQSTAMGMDSQTYETEAATELMREFAVTSEQTAVSTQQGASEVSRVSDMVSQGESEVEQVKLKIDELADNILQASQYTTRLKDESQSIGEIIQLIQTIAEQTNLLALNAAIEAARAGDQGRGFSVVSDEVRDLAVRTEKATKEIQKKILSLQGEIGKLDTTMQSGQQVAEESVNRSLSAAESLRAITHSVLQINDMNQQIAVVAEQQKQSSEMLKDRLQGIHTEANNAQGLSSELETHASHMHSDMEQLESVVASFKTNRRAA
ncbi:ammonium transporter [Neptuniibacter sp. QD37_11]|uniref:ammonium transporter n=1 Tax=Neptuniibacter sp. QD37_11 TaxID=3398209 RepID=UPI0039F4C1BF